LVHLMEIYFVNSFYKLDIRLSICVKLKIYLLQAQLHSPGLCMT